MSIFNNNILAGAAAQSTTTPVHTIDQSIRFNDNDSAYMYRTFGTATSLTTTTLSLWVKRCTLGTDQRIMVGATSAYSDSLYFRFTSSDTLEALNGPAAIYLRTTQVFRDTSAWYHIVFVLDTSNTISSERFRFYVNGQRITDVSAVYPSLNQTFKWNGPTGEHTIGTSLPSLGNYLDSYLAEIVFIDGQALDPSSFGEYNSSNIWIPKDVSGLTFGNNGFYIDGRDSADLGDDESGNGNDFTVVNFAAHDQVTDSPTNNFAVLNPLDERGSGTLSNGNLQMAFGATNDNVTATQGLNTGKWYWEVYIVDKDDPYVGVQDSGIASTGYSEDAVALWVDGGYIYEDGSDTGDRSTTYVNGDIVGVAFDVDNKKIWWSKNGQWYSADDSSTATINISEVEAGNQAQVITRSPDFFMPFVGNYNTGTVIMNFGQEGTFAGNTTAGGNSDGNGVGNFKYSVPSGYLALCTKNLGS